jgi:hypothetical protein
VKHPGDVVDVTFKIVDETIINSISPKLIRGSGSKAQFLVMNISALQKNEQGWQMQGRLVMGANFKPDDVYQLKVKDKTISMSFRGWNWSPQGGEVSPEFEYNVIPLLHRTWWYKNWGKALGVTVLIGLLAGLAWLKTSKKRRALKQRDALRNEWKERIANARSISDLSSIWQQRDSLMELFPESQDAIKQFFMELHRVQFAKNPNELEISSVLSKRLIFLSQLKGETNGA